MRLYCTAKHIYISLHAQDIQIFFFCPCSEKVNFPPKLFTWLMKMNIPLIFPISMRRAYSTQLTQRPSFTHLTAVLKLVSVAMFVHVYESVDIKDLNDV